jgi:prolyl-tRNA synthetase
VRGDHDLQEQKLLDAAGVGEGIRPGTAEEIQGLLGAMPGSLGAVGVEGIAIYADLALRGRHNMTTGANEDDWHYSGVDVDRDIATTKWADLRAVVDGQPCLNCGGELRLWKGIEVGHIFKIGTKYSEVFDVLVQDENGQSHPIQMGSYGIGVERGMAAVVESSHDDKGIIWPVSVAPYEVVVTIVRPDEDNVMAAGEKLYLDLLGAGVEALLDDREERPGVKFADSELIGVPYRVTVGPRGVADGVVEMTTRRGLVSEEVPLDQVGDRLIGLVGAQRHGS